MRLCITYTVMDCTPKFGLRVLHLPLQAADVRIINVFPIRSESFATIHPLHAAKACLPSLVFVNRASYRR